jgi:hypothetical protein
MYLGQLSYAFGDYPMKHEKMAFLPWMMQMRPQTGWLPNKALIKDQKIL